LNVYTVSLQHSVLFGERRQYTVIGSTAAIACSKSVRHANKTISDRRGGFHVTTVIQQDELVR
jgi:hypothetical protein